MLDPGLRLQPAIDRFAGDNAGRRAVSRVALARAMRSRRLKPVRLRGLRGRRFQFRLCPFIIASYGDYFAEKAGRVLYER